MVHAGSRAGFLQGAGLIYKSGSTTGDYHGQMNSKNFEKWIREKILQNLPSRSVVVYDNAPYHSLKVDKSPSKHSVKSEMISWLQRHGVFCGPAMRKGQIYDLILTKKQKEKFFKIDQLLNAHGHIVVRLPPYMSELSPIELAWSKVRKYVRENNVTGDLSLKRLLDLTTEGIETVTAKDWEGYCQYVEKLEQQYWERDGVVADVIDSKIISNLNDSVDDEEISREGATDFSDSETLRPL
ncbi:hypothetical protein L798_14581 [Zootermopsis nevadensis]|uniref:Tc1-like transposase DDE domain-containing protein n=2 Tax=Zootermopsis nevadensis TaxID=136037 RepID=A0A067QZ07_ZOONE|nr:hypothetical protein L798_14581 [Zootermopsis nevadensis]